MDERLLRRPPPTGRLDPVRTLPPHTQRPDPLGRHRDRTRWMAYIDGAIESGQRATAETLAALEVVDDG